jgi:hypothetical protein
MPVTDVRVALRVASSSNLRPSALRGSAVAVEATVLDQQERPIQGAILHLGYVLTSGRRVTVRNRRTDARGIASISLALDDVGLTQAFAEIISPQVEIATRTLDLVPRDLRPRPPQRRMVMPNGDLLVLGNGRVMTGGPINV